MLIEQCHQGLTGGCCCLQSRVESTLTISEEEPGKSCRQTLEGEVEFRLMGLGHLAERIVADSLRKVYLGIPAIVDRYTPHPLSSRSPPQPVVRHMLPQRPYTAAS